MEQLSKMIVIYQSSVSEIVQNKLRKDKLDYIKKIHVDGLEEEFTFKLKAKKVVFMPETLDRAVKIMKMEEWLPQTEFFWWDEHKQKAIPL